MAIGMESLTRVRAATNLIRHWIVSGLATAQISRNALASGFRMFTGNRTLARFG